MISTGHFHVSLESVFGLGLLAFAALCAPAQADDGHVTISNLRFGLVCGLEDSESGGRVCFQTYDIQLTGEGRCVYDHRDIPCTWYGYSFDYALPADSVDLDCDWSTNHAIDEGNPNGVRSQDVTSGKFKLTLKDKSGHYFNPLYIGFNGPLYNLDQVDENHLTCSYNGEAVLDISYRVHYPEK